MFLGETNPKRAFYESAVRSYGFLDRHHNLHGLLELETESVKNLALAKIRSHKELMLVSGLVIWDEPKLLEVMKALDRFDGNYWGKEDAKAIKEIWKVAYEANKYHNQHDQTRIMHKHARRAEETLQKWSTYKNTERGIIANILSLSENADKWKNGKKDPDNTKKILDDTIRQLSNLNSLKGELNFDDDSKEWAQYGSKEFKEIKRVLVNVLDKNKKYEKWRESLTKLKERSDKLHKQLTDSKQQSEYFKLRLDEWKQKLTDLQKQSKKPPSNQDSEDNAAREKELSEEIEKLSGKIKEAKASIKTLSEQIEMSSAELKNVSKDLESILNAVIKELFNKLQKPSIAYNRRIEDANHVALRDLAQNGLQEFLIHNIYKNRLQTIYEAGEPKRAINNDWLNDNPNGEGKNYNTEGNVKIYILDNKIPLTPRFQREVDEVVKLIFSEYKIDETTITPFLNDLHAIEAFLSGQNREKIMNDNSEDDLRYVCMIIEDFRDTKRNLDINIFKNLASWLTIFQGAARNKFENEILSKIGECLTFAKGIDSINFYAAGGYARRAILHILPLRSEIGNDRKRDLGLPTSKDMETIRKKIKEIFKYGLQIGNNDEVKLYENKEKIQEILKLLYELKLVNFPKNIDGIINVFESYSKVFEFVVSVWDKDYKTPLHRKTSYICKIDYEGDAKKGGENIVRTVEEL
jgi:hypothetical protein